MPAHLQPTPERSALRVKRALGRLAPDRPVHLRLIHASAPLGCVCETTSTVQTVAGTYTLRARRIAELVRPRSTAVAYRLELALLTPSGRAGGTGFELVDADFLRGGWRSPSDDLAVLLQAGATIEAAVTAPRLRLVPRPDASQVHSGASALIRTAA